MPDSPTRTMRALPNTLAEAQKLTGVPPERFRDKLGRTVAAVVMAGAMVAWGGNLPQWLQTGIYVTAALVVSGEWFLYPLRAVVAFLKDIPPIIAEFRRSIKNGNGAKPPSSGPGQ